MSQEECSLVRLESGQFVMCARQMLIVTVICGGCSRCVTASPAGYEALARLTCAHIKACTCAAACFVPLRPSRALET
jgi:hypothetical protein